MASNGRRTSMGRRKVKIEFIEKAGARRAAFTKRRAGLFKTAHELSDLRGAEVAVVAFSPFSGKPFSFGHTSVDAVFGRLSSGARGGPAGERTDASAAAPASSKYARELARLNHLLQEQKARRRELKKALRAGLSGGAVGNGAAAMFDGRLDEVDAEELVRLRSELERVKGDVLQRLRQLEMEGQTNMAAAAAAGGNGGIEEVCAGALGHATTSMMDGKVPSPAN